MIRTTLAAAAKWAKAKMRGGSDGLGIAGVSTDTRTLRPGNLFVPLIGESYNGHDFAEEALAKGAAALMWQADQGEPPHAPVLIVENTLAALQKLAAEYRRSLDVRVIGVTGSNGKTTTKDMIAAALSAAYRVQKTQGNLNNHIGVPLTLLSLEPETEYAVVEMGMSGLGEIELLSGLAGPDIAVITNIGEAHLQQLGSREAIARAKLEITKGLPEGGLLVVPGEEPLIERQLRDISCAGACRVLRFGSGKDCDVRLKSVEISREETAFRVEGSPVRFTIPLLGRHNAVNALAAIAVARALGVSDEIAAEGLAALKASGMRIERVEGKGGVTFWNDAYNASPSSMRAALELLAEIGGYRRKIAVLGDMLELGEAEAELHRSIGRMLDPERIDLVYTYGRLGEEIAKAAAERFPEGAVQSFTAKETLAEALEKTAGYGDLVLVKASRGMKLETLVEHFKKEGSEGGGQWN